MFLQRSHSGFFLLAAFSIWIAGCSKAPAPAGSPQTAGKPALVPVVFQSNWYAEADHGGYYQALAKGYYKEAGLDVKIQQGGPGAFPVQKVAAGQVQFAIARSDDVILAVQQKLPVLMVSSQLEHDPQVIIMHDSSPVRGFADLDGRSIMVEPASAWVTYVEKKFGITIKTIPENYGNGSFLADKTSIQQAFVTNEPYLFDQLKVSTRWLRIADSGYDPYRVLFTNRNYASRNPEVVRAFVAASIRGWEDYLHGDAGPGDALIAKDYAQNSPGLLAFARKIMLETGTAGGDPAKGERIGLIARKRLGEQIAILKDLGLLTQPLTVDEVATFDFLPPDLKVMAE